MALDVKVKIDLLKPLGELGFGYPLLFQYGAETEIAYTECTSLDDLAVDLEIAEDSDIYKAAKLIFMQDDVPEKIAVYATTSDAKTGLEVIMDKGWRQLIAIGENTDYDTVIPELIEATTNKMFFATVATDPTESKNYQKYNRTIGFVYKATDGYEEVAVAALVGATASYKPGSFTYKNIILKGLTAQTFTELQLNTMHKYGCISMVNKAGDDVTTEGIVGSGEYIDIIDSQDWIIQNLEYRTQKKLNAAKKIPYDNRGIAMLESVAVDVLKTAYDNGMIAMNDDGSPAYSVNYILRANCEPTDIAARKYLGGKFSFVLAGAIHNVQINGEISVA